MIYYIDKNYFHSIMNLAYRGRKAGS